MAAQIIPFPESRIKRRFEAPIYKSRVEEIAELLKSCMPEPAPPPKKPRKGKRRAR